MASAIDQLNFLVDDDEEFSRIAVEKLLVRLGAPQVLTASEGHEAMTIIEHGDPMIGFVLTDLNMTPVNGLELLRSIRTGHLGLDPMLPVVMLTGYRDMSMTSTAIDLDVDGFVTKPVDAQMLAGTVKKASTNLRRRRSSTTYEAVKVPDMARMARLVEATHMSAAAESEMSEAMPGDDANQGSDHQSILAPHRVSVCEDHVGSRVVRDIVTGAGETIIPAGTKLTKFLINQLVELGTTDTSLSYIWVVRSGR